MWFSHCRNSAWYVAILAVVPFHNFLNLLFRNTLTALTQLKTRDWIATSPGAREVARGIFSEGVRVAKGKGIAIPDDTLETLMIKYTTLEGSSSMLTDSLNEKPMEIEVRCTCNNPILGILIPQTGNTWYNHA